MFCFSEYQGGFAVSCIECRVDSWRCSIQDIRKGTVAMLCHILRTAFKIFVPFCCWIANKAQQLNICSVQRKLLEQCNFFGMFSLGVHFWVFVMLIQETKSWMTKGASTKPLQFLVYKDLWKRKWFVLILLCDDLCGGKGAYCFSLINDLLIGGFHQYYKNCLFVWKT